MGDRLRREQPPACENHTSGNTLNLPLGNYLSDTPGELCERNVKLEFHQRRRDSIDDRKINNRPARIRRRHRAYRTAPADANRHADLHTYTS
jgi:hypothetical protein